MRNRKAIMIGASVAGKTALFNALRNRPFTPDYIESISIDTQALHMVSNDIEVTKVNLLDVAGNKKYVPLLNYSLRNLDIVLLVINIHKAFEEQKQYLLTLIKSILSLNILRPKFLMVTTHNDLAATPVVSQKQIDDLKTEIQKSTGNDVVTLAVSAKTGENIEILRKKLKLTVDTQNTNPEELNDVKKNMERIFNGYISFFKCSLFGHHHNGRARYILNAIKRAETISEIHIILETQLTIFNAREHNPTVEGIFKKIGLDSRWTKHLINKPAIPDQSGYYQTILRAKDFVNTVSPPGDFSLRHKHFSYV